MTNSYVGNDVRVRVLCQLSDILLSATCALAVVAVLIFTSIYWSAQFGGWYMSLNLSLHRSRQADFGIDLALALWSFICAVCILIVFKACLRIPFTASLVRSFAGIIAVVVPAACFWLIWHFQPDYFLYAKAYARWLPLEECFAVGYILLYWYGRWPISVWTTVTLLAFHSALWYRSYAVTFSGGRPSLSAIPLVAFGAILAWGFNMRSLPMVSKASRRHR